MKRLFLFVFVALFSLGVHALDLNAAKARGLVGEQHDGYLGFVVAPTDEVKKLVKAVNAGRNAEFRRVAKKSGASLAQVQLRFYQRAVKATAKGHYYKNSGNKWVKK
jgi:hypothetical protein